MTAWLDGLGGILRDASVAAALLSSLCALLMVACQQPARRCLVARLAMLGLLALIPLTAFGPRPRWEVVTTLRRFAPPSGTMPGWLGGDWRLQTFERSLIGLYLGGVAVGLGWVGLGLWASRRLVRGSREAPEELRSRYHLLGSGTRRSPALRVSDRLRGPVLVGMLRPTIVIPSGMVPRERDEALRLGLLHELVHAERRDAGFALLGSLAGACWFFLPMLWWIRAQMRLDQEFLADRAASEQYGPFGTYAASLVTLADARTTAGASDRNRSTEAFRRTPLMLRVLMLVRCPFGVESSPPLWWRWSLVVVVGLATVLVSGLSLRSAEPIRLLATSPKSLHGTFRLSRLVIEPTRLGADGRPRPYTVMCPLADRFELKVDVWALPDELPMIRVAGQPLGPIERPGDAPLLAEGYHPVHIVCDGRIARVWVDGYPVVEPADGFFPSGLLGLQPAPGQFGHFRDLVVSW